jgi:cytochrome c oxidase assembly protein subunit 15
MVAVGATHRLENDRAIAAWLLACCAMIFFMVVIGGITRLTESGLSITEWQPIEGIVPPFGDAQWQAAFARYQAIPQYHAIHADMSLDDFKHIFFWEYLHRLWGRLIGFVFLLPFLYFLIRGQIGRRLALPLGGIFLLGALQGAIGWWMVESGLETRIEVSQYRLAIHLGMAVLIYLAMLWVALSLLHPPSSFPRKRESSAAVLDPRFRGGDDEKAIVRLRFIASVLLCLIFLTLIAGAFVAGTRAGYLDNTFPLMEERLVPPDYWHLTPLWRNWFENLTTVQWDHRVLAETSWLAIAAFWIASFRVPLRAIERWAIHALFFFACLQFALGVATLLSVVWLPLAALHQAGALALLTAAVVARHSLQRSEPAPALSSYAAR